MSKGAPPPPSSQPEEEVVRAIVNEPVMGASEEKVGAEP